MNLSKEQMRHALNEYLRSISSIADLEYQERVWINNQGPECQAYDDAVCDFFDIGDPILDEYQNFGISKSQYQILKQFRDQFEAFADADDRPYLPEEFIDTPEWDEITKMAKEVLQAFHYGSDKSEGAAQP